MCGIFGILHKDGTPVDLEVVQNASQMLNHRGPDGEGFYIKNNIGLGHKRLSIIDLSDKAAQPFRKHNMIISYNGEIYNFLEIRKVLEKEGLVFESGSDTEVFLSAYYHWGEKAFQKFNGMWAALIWNELDQNLVITRDRFGMKPLFIFESGNSISFASEIKAFSVLPNWTGNLNNSNVYDFLTHGLLNHNEDTFYQNVRTLKVASIEKYNYLGELISSKKYFEIDLHRSSTNFSTVEYRSLFSDAIRCHYTSDVKVAAALSGGLDSSSIVAESLNQEKLNETFTYKASEPEFSEFQYVEVLEKALHFESNTISPSFDEHIDGHKEALTANEGPCLNMNLITSYLLYKEVAKNNYKVILAGQGADELLLGYNFYYSPFLRELLLRKPVRFVSELIQLIVKYPEKIFRSLKKNFRKTSYSDYISGFSKNESRSHSSFSDVYYHYLGWGQLYGLLQYEDRLSMAHGVEARLPFLDINFASYLNKIPFDSKIVSGIRKYPLRDSMRTLIPKEILNRRDKLGYLTPQQLWIEENQDFFRGRIERGIEKHQEWFRDDINDFLEEAFKKKKHYDFIWRTFSFLEFLEIKL